MKNLICIGLFCAIGLFCNAQNYSNDRSSGVEEKLLFIDYTVTNTKKTTDNLVLINQQGKYNVSKITIKADKSFVDVQQIGNKNSVDVDVVADKVEERIIQIGNNNVFEDYNHLNKKFHNVDVYQNGNNQSIYMNGNNNIIEKLKIKQIGNNKTIRINNYK